jgi:hypothetical protein
LPSARRMAEDRVLPVDSLTQIVCAFTRETLLHQR